MSDLFHPLIADWFRQKFENPTAPQEAGWPWIATGDNTLIAAPTGSGKTLTAFLACIDRLVRRALSDQLRDEMSVVYVSPLRALSNDMQRNLEEPLADIRRFAAERGVELPEIRVGLRTGDTTSSQRQSIVRRPPHLFVTTPESLYLMLTSRRGREALRSVETVIVDEIHALVRDKRGSHLAVTLERLEALAGRRLQRIGLSATQRPIERVARFLVGTRDQPTELPDDAPPEGCHIVDIGHGREIDLAIETPPSDLGAVCTHEQWEEVNARIIDLINEHRSTLIFVNTRRLAERVTHQLTETLGEDLVGSHHGSMSAEMRLKTERRLKSGELRAVVATASLELGLDVGYIDLVIQIGSPRAIATLLQRIGRSGHSLGLIPRGRLFALSRDELLECMALVRAVRRGRLDVVRIPTAPLDILAQQVVAEVVGQEWDEDELFALIRHADPYRDLSRERFDQTVEYLSEGISSQAGRSRVYLHHDRVQRRLRARKGAGIAATSNGGAIPDIGSFRVITEDGTVVGTLDEDFAIESSRGDIFLLGNTSWRLLHVRANEVLVADAQGAPPTIPFWRGEAPGRTLELSEELSELREELEARVDDELQTVAWLVEETSCSEPAAEQTVEYAAAQKAAIGLLPTQRRVVFERFFDETGGMQLVVHAPFGAGITRAWGFAMRKRFCRSFDFELQATADDDGFILSLGPQHSFPIESLFPMLTSRNALGLLEQAILTVPMFQLRWRWNVTRALLVARMRNGKRVAPSLQRFRADDLLTAVFPKLTGCQEEHTGDHEVPDHPLAQQTMADCLFEAVDYDGLETVLRQLEAGEITLIARDSREPSPFSYELLNSNPYAFLDGGEAQERRARAVATRRSLTVESVRDLARLDPEAIEQVRQEAQPQVRDADELHDLLLTRLLLFESNQQREWSRWFDELVTAYRASTLRLPGGASAWVPAERLPAVMAVYPEAVCDPELTVPRGVRTDWPSTEARVVAIRGMLETCGPITASRLAAELHVTTSQAEAALEALEGEGLVLRGRFELTGDDAEVEWCHRRLLARVHRLTMQGLRQQIQPVPSETYVRFLLQHHEVTRRHRRSGVNAVFDAIARLQGLEIPAVAWERDVLAARVTDYRSAWLDELCLNGEVGWGRLSPHKPGGETSRPGGLTKVAPTSLWLRSDLDWVTAACPGVSVDSLSEPAQSVFQLLRDGGALFAADLIARTSLSVVELNSALSELANRGLITADGFAGLRRLFGSGTARRAASTRRRLSRTRGDGGSKGRWSVWREPSPEEDISDEAVEQWAWQLLRRWGVVFRDLLDRETAAPRWFRLLLCLRRLEARGEVRGGRFITGVAGEQFASPETVTDLRTLRDAEPDDEVIVLSAADPLNLAGVITGDVRVPRTAGNKVAFVGGLPVAALQAGEIISLREDGNHESARAALQGSALDADPHVVSAEASGR